MYYRPKHRSAEIGASSLADIAFLLLSYFLMTTEIANEKGLPLYLPEWRKAEVLVRVPERNLFSIHINSRDEIMVEGEIQSLEGVRKKIQSFILNQAGDEKLSESPRKAIVSLKADRGASHGRFIAALDEIQAAYNELYAARAGMSVQRFRNLRSDVPLERRVLEKAKEGLPMNISIAEPSPVVTDESQ